MAGEVDTDIFRGLSSLQGGWRHKLWHRGGFHYCGEEVRNYHEATSPIKEWWRLKLPFESLTITGKTETQTDLGKYTEKCREMSPL